MATAGLALIGVPTNSSGISEGVARALAVLRGLAAALARRAGFTDACDLVLPAPPPGIRFCAGLKEAGAELDGRRACELVWSAGGRAAGRQ